MNGTFTNHSNRVVRSDVQKTLSLSISVVELCHNLITKVTILTYICSINNKFFKTKARILIIHLFCQVLLYFNKEIHNRD